MSVQSSIESKLTEALEPVAMEIVNDSHNHSGPASESHFLVHVVSEKFLGLNRVSRQRLVYELLKEELAGPVHALSLKLQAPEEFQESNVAAGPHTAPKCHGGSKKHS